LIVKKTAQIARLLHFEYVRAQAFPGGLAWSSGEHLQV